MKLRAVSGMMLTLFMFSMLTLAFNIQPVGAIGAIYIRADGSVDPPTAPISSVDNVTYTFTGNINDYVIVERDNIVVDGAGYTVSKSKYEGPGGIGIYLSGRSNITIKDMEIGWGFRYGLWLEGSSNNTIYGNNISIADSGIYLSKSSNNTIYGNNMTSIRLEGSSNNTIYGNNEVDIHLGGAFSWSSSNNNTIYGNNIRSIRLDAGSSNNMIYHNNFMRMPAHDASTNIWDDGYPSGGNYWSDYIRDDFYSGPYQNETGFDGIIDTPYVIDENNRDNYPLMVPWPLKYKIYSLTVDPIFYDITGTTLIQPSSWTIEFPSGTARTVSSPVTYNLTQTGDYSIVNIIWKGVEVIPETAPTTSLTSDMVWSPSINCLLPTSLPISLSSSTSYVGFKVEINGNLTCNEVGVSGAPILLSYSVTGGDSWSDITLVNTASDGGYSAVWMPPATGNYLVRAIWEGNSTYPRTNTTVNLAVTPFEDQNVFSVTSNSTVSELAFNSTSRELSFTVTGPSDTTGYVNVYIAKTLIDNIADVKVYLDGDQLDYTVTSTDDSWLLHFTYRHSTRTITISLGLTPFIPPQLITPLSLGILAVALAVVAVILIFKIRKGTPPTILNGVFSKSKQTQIATTIDTKRRKTMLKKRVGSIYQKMN